jgi:hypothetical protein
MAHIKGSANIGRKRENYDESEVENDATIVVLCRITFFLAGPTKPREPRERTGTIQ